VPIWVPNLESIDDDDVWRSCNLMCILVLQAKRTWRLCAKEAFGGVMRAFDNWYKIQGFCIKSLLVTCKRKMINIRK
jgi:hypothetical protein